MKKFKKSQKKIGNMKPPKGWEKDRFGSRCRFLSWCNNKTRGSLLECRCVSLCDDWRSMKIITHRYLPSDKLWRLKGVETTSNFGKLRLTVCRKIGGGGFSSFLKRCATTCWLFMNFFFHRLVMRAIRSAPLSALIRQRETNTTIDLSPLAVQYFFSF